MGISDLANLPGYSAYDHQLFISAGLPIEYYEKYLNRTQIPDKNLSLARYIRLYQKLMQQDEALSPSNSPRSQRHLPKELSHLTSSQPVEQAIPEESRSQICPLQEPYRLGQA